MKIENLFAKKITRPVNGVIKAEQDEGEGVYLELEEYVVTNELKKHFNDFFRSFNRSIEEPTENVGVWISGFFGAGKSHLLKILSYILSNKEVKGKRAISFFEEKIDDKLLFNEMLRAANLNCEIIRFNIDAQADADSRTQKEPITKVLKKVFDRHCGYFGDIGWVADLERKLDKDGKYDLFKDTFKALTGDDWENRRPDIYFERDYVIDALHIATGISKESAEILFDNAEKNYVLDINRLAQLVKDYCNERGPKFKLIFCIDEIGQYIGDSHDLMLNLQTIVEQFGILTKGKAWVIVTSQEALDTILKKELKERDFSKIQSRFDIRINLSSANTDEVIKKRILEKTDNARDHLKALYGSKNVILKNIINFTDDTFELRNYKDADEFVEVYPFIPYQFKLLQLVFEQIRGHGATGKSLSEGARSMLASFKEAAEFYKDEDTSILIPFWKFYDTIEKFLDANVKRTILQAENNQRINDFDIKVLKTLFLIKYIDGVPKNIENITTLMIDKIDVNKKELREKIQKSLEILRRENLIQKSGNEFIFLTNLEQDVNRDIDSIIIDEDEVIKEIGKHILDGGILEGSRYKYSSYNVFDLVKKIDDIIIGNAAGELTINIITPYHKDYEMDETAFKMKTKGTKTLIIKMPNDKDFVDEQKMILKTNIYVSKAKAKSDEIEKIISSKAIENRKRKEELIKKIEDLVINSEIFVEGEKIKINASTAKEKLNSALEQLVKAVYKKLDYITNHYKDSDIKDILQAEFLQQTFVNSNNNGLAVNEVLQYLEINFNNHSEVTLKDIINNYKKSPYGWSEIDTIGIVAILLKTNRAIAKYYGKVINLEDKNLKEYLTRASNYDKLIIQFKEIIDIDLIHEVKYIISDIFDRYDLTDNQDELYQDIKNILTEKINWINQTLKNYDSKNKYPGKKDLEIAKDKLNDFLIIYDERELFNKISKDKKLLEEANETIRVIRSFFENQVDLFNKGLSYVEKFNNITINQNTIYNCINEIKAILEDSYPYNKIQEIANYIETIDSEYESILNQNKERVKKKIEDDIKVIRNHINNADGEYLGEDFINRMIKRLEFLIDNVDKSTDINYITALANESETKKVEIIQEVSNEIYRIKNEKGKLVEKPKAIKVLKFDQIFTKPINIKNPDDIEKLLLLLKDKLYKEVEENEIVLM